MSRKFLFFISIIIIVSCSGTELFKNTISVGNFNEKQYGFLESIRHVNTPNYYSEIPFSLTFGGIINQDTLLPKQYSWLRNSVNLKIAFNAFAEVGLDKFISKEDYFKKNNDWCCGTRWENYSLNVIVKEFIKSTRSSLGVGYFYKFWKRRRGDGTGLEVRNIFLSIDQYYNKGEEVQLSEPRDSVLIGLLEFDAQLLNSTTLTYKRDVFLYFDYLKQVSLDYSAYKLVCHNPTLKFEKDVFDSLLTSIQHDTIIFEKYQELNDNQNGWITPGFYPDPNRQYGP